jgi:hypothetical protein
VSNFASVLQYLGNYEAAEAMFRRPIEGREQVLGLGHLNVITDRVASAKVLLPLGKMDEADSLDRKTAK